jgi:UDP-N-acetyl-D-galactosamine dehydrogenase
MYPPVRTAPTRQRKAAAPARTTRVTVLGLGYVGLPLAVALAKHFDVTGFDIDARRLKELETGHDRTGEIEPDRLTASTLAVTSETQLCLASDFYIVTVPTPIDEHNRPDLRIVEAASRTVGEMLRAAHAEGLQPIVVYESTVYPGVTEDVCAPILEAHSGLLCGQDFFLGYSPERINPGDREHTIERITKVVSGQTPEVLDRVADLYGSVTSGGVFRAASIKAAEAAKVIENAQRDINIAFMNEITQIFGLLDLSVWDVLAAARTKWNFLPFTPGLVGGHCIGVDPYYLSHRRQTRHRAGPGPDLQGRRARPAQFQGGRSGVGTGSAGPHGHGPRSAGRRGRGRARIPHHARRRRAVAPVRLRSASGAAPRLPRSRADAGTRPGCERRDIGGFEGCAGECGGLDFVKG